MMPVGVASDVFQELLGVLMGRLRFVSSPKGPLGASWVPLGGPWGLFLRGPLGLLEAFGGRLGGLLGPSGHLFGLRLLPHSRRPCRARHIFASCHHAKMYAARLYCLTYRTAWL
eukprot:9415482-Pyramimonas_sp.AAC.1